MSRGIYEAYIRRSNMILKELYKDLNRYLYNPLLLCCCIVLFCVSIFFVLCSASDQTLAVSYCQRSAARRM